MKGRGLMKRKKLLFLSAVALATLAAVFFLYTSSMRTISPPMSAGTTSPPASADSSNPALPTNTDGGDVLQASGTPTGSFTQKQAADNSRAGQGHGGTGFMTAFNDESLPTWYVDNSDIDSSPVTNADADQVSGSAGKGSDTPADDFTPILLANHGYPEYDHDFQGAIGGGGGGYVGGRGPKSTAPDKSLDTSFGPNEPGSPPVSHTPEPATMLLMGTGLICLAGLGRKRFWKSERMEG